MTGTHETRWWSVITLQRCSRCILQSKPTESLDTRWWSLTHLQRCSRCILLFKPSGPYDLSIIWKSNLTDKIKRSFFQAAVVLILLYGCTTWTLTKRPPTSHHENYPSQTNQTCRTLLEKQGRAHKWCTPMDPNIWPRKKGQSARTYIQQLCEDMGCSPEDLPEAMNDRENWRERVRDIHARGTTWWWWWWWWSQTTQLNIRYFLSQLNDQTIQYSISHF